MEEREDALSLRDSCFQGSVNIVLNCIVLGTIFAGGSLIGGSLAASLSCLAKWSEASALGPVFSITPTRPGQQILKNFNLIIPPCKTVAIVGESGGDKSTVPPCLERFYDPSSGGSCGRPGYPDTGPILAERTSHWILSISDLIKNPSILVLDEATSALDAEYKSGWFKRLWTGPPQDAPVLIIAHRLSTIQRADLICVMSNGRIVEG
ncbi:hypothetical protein J4Q44_G00188870 [Coregonus suidteri]|uniref:ABC transporter domain-containing protein n=1 Tax=Coregonus suidteri TaxID=861788 RepID=A0AAN8LEQ4_9TELE